MFLPDSYGSDLLHAPPPKKKNGGEEFGLYISMCAWESSDHSTFKTKNDSINNFYNYNRYNVQATLPEFGKNRKAGSEYFKNGSNNLVLTHYFNNFLDILSHEKVGYYWRFYRSPDYLSQF